MGKYKWAVTQKGFDFGKDDIFDTKREAEQYKRDCFEPEHEAKVIKITIEDPPTNQR